MTSNATMPNHLAFFNAEFKDIDSKIDILVDKNKTLKSELETLQVKFNYMMAETEMKIMDAHQQAQQEVAAANADAHEKVTKSEANYAELEEKNKTLEEKMACILKRLESLC